LKRFRIDKEKNT